MGAYVGQMSVFITESKSSVFKAVRNDTIYCNLHYIENDKVDAWNQDLVIEMPMSLFASHIKALLFMWFVETQGRGKEMYVQRR